MIPRDYVTEWRQRAPWVEDAQVEQDLLLSRAIVEIFRVPALAEALAFRGGTALYKLYADRPARYSEDVDLVQREPGAIGAVIDSLREVLDPWLGEPRRATKAGSVVLVYRVQSEGPPPLPMRLKVEINSREHFSVFGITERAFEVSSRWFTGQASVPTFELDELLGTKLRALYQRKKGRDLFDLGYSKWRGTPQPDRIVTCFRRYLAEMGLAVSRAEFEANLVAKLDDPSFVDDVKPLLAPGTPWDPQEASRWVLDELVARVPGEPWKGR